jgi:hypothetical protein
MKMDARQAMDALRTLGGKYCSFPSGVCVMRRVQDWRDKTKR